MLSAQRVIFSNLLGKNENTPALTHLACTLHTLLLPESPFVIMDWYNYVDYRLLAGRPCHMTLSCHADVIEFWRHDIILWWHVTSWRHMMWHDVVTSHVMSHFTVQYLKHVNLSEESFFNVVTLPFDLWPWPFNLSKILSMYISTLKFRSIGQMVLPWQ